MSPPTSSTSSRAASAGNFLPYRAAAQRTHQSGSLYTGGALHGMVPAAGTSLYSRVLAANVLTSSASTPCGDGSATYFSSKARYLDTNGSAFSTTTSRRGPRNGKVFSSSTMAAKSAL